MSDVQHALDAMADRTPTVADAQARARVLVHTGGFVRSATLHYWPLPVHERRVTGGRDGSPRHGKHRGAKATVRFDTGAYLTVPCRDVEMML